MRISILVAVLALIVGYVAGTVNTSSAQAGPAIVNGDCDGDGSINLADAVYLLNYIFNGGPEPVPTLVAPHPVMGTGQSNCYEYEGLVPCDSGIWPGQGGQDGGVVAPGRFQAQTISGDEVHIDSLTGLMWHVPTTTGELNWQQSLVECDSLVAAGFDDWRLPTIRELESLLSISKPTLEIAPFIPDGGPGDDFYWSSTTWEYGLGQGALCLKTVNSASNIKVVSFNKLGNPTQFNERTIAVRTHMQP